MRSKLIIPHSQRNYDLREKKKNLIPIKLPNWTIEQEEIFWAIQRYCLFAGGFGSGKTTLGSYKTLTLALLHPRTVSVIGSYTAKMIKDNIFPIFFDEVLAQLPSNSWKYYKFDNEIRLDNNSIIRFRQFEDEGKARGPNIFHLWLDEATVKIDKNTFEMALARIRQGPYNYFTATTNADSPEHHLYKFFFHPKPKIKNQIKIVTALTDSNRANLPIEYLNYLDDMPEEWKKRYTRAQWLSFEGQFFDNFDTKLHTSNFENEIEKIDKNKWEFHIAIDHGYNAPFVALLIGRHVINNTVCVFKEFYKEGLDYEQRVDFLASDYIRYNPIDCIPDTNEPAANRMIQERLKLDIVPPLKYDRKLSGLFFIKRMFNTLIDVPIDDYNLETEKQPWLVIHSGCKKLISEIIGTEWEEDKPGKRETVKKKNDHGVDALRYYCDTYENPD